MDNSGGKHSEGSVTRDDPDRACPEEPQCFIRHAGVRRG